MKKLLLLTFLFSVSFVFAQQTSNAVTINKNQSVETIFSISASPNPFSVKTRIDFTSSKEQILKFTIKNLLGKTVYLEDVDVKIGVNSVQFNRNNLLQGMYIYSLQTETEVVSKRLIIK